MKKLHIDSNQGFYEFLEKYTADNKTRIFRGVSSNHHSLVPSIGRLKKVGKETSLDEKDEDLIFRYFQQRSKPFLLRDFSEMDLLSIAQHHGLPTRLLDWTFNPLAALYFAVERSIQNSGSVDCSVVYVHKAPEAVINKAFETYQVKELEYFIPNYHDQRIANQNGLFTVHPYPWVPLDPSSYDIVTIDLNYRRNLRKLLNRLGVNESTIYPGLDGVANHIKWMKTNFF